MPKRSSSMMMGVVVVVVLIVGFVIFNWTNSQFSEKFGEGDNRPFKFTGNLPPEVNANQKDKKFQIIGNNLFDDASKKLSDTKYFIQKFHKNSPFYLVNTSGVGGKKYQIIIQ